MKSANLLSALGKLRRCCSAKNKTMNGALQQTMTKEQNAGNKKKNLLTGGFLHFFPEPHLAKLFYPVIYSLFR
jgi:hypothetical protein